MLKMSDRDKVYAWSGHQDPVGPYGQDYCLECGAILKRSGESHSDTDCIAHLRQLVETLVDVLTEVDETDA